MFKKLNELTDHLNISRQASYDKRKRGTLGWKKLEKGWYSLDELLNIVRDLSKK